MHLSSCLHTILVSALLYQQYEVMAQNIASERHDRWHRQRSCPMGTWRNSRLDTLLDALFPGLFVNTLELLDIVFEKLFLRLVSSEVILQLNTTTPPGDGPIGDEACCDMITEVIKPLTVQKNDSNYQVVHLLDSDQLVTTTSCLTDLGPCTNGNCFNRKGYTWVLVFDYEVNYYPPVKFIPLEINVGCECL